tara:strand:- start:1969 stop:2205 length:237 start_codon:yes stop_codon:yes gene_type:complete
MSEIEQGIEIPRPPFKIKWHFGDFEIGDSKAIPYEDNQLEVTRFRVAASAYGKRTGKVFISRSNAEDGVRVLRVWRVE